MTLWNRRFGGGEREKQDVQLEELLLKMEKSHNQSVLEALDMIFPKYFDCFWEWQESLIWTKDLSIFDENFKAWLRHVNPTEKMNTHGYVPRSHSDNFHGPLAECSQQISEKWDSGIFIIDNLNLSQVYSPNNDK